MKMTKKLIAVLIASSMILTVGCSTSEKPGTTTETKEGLQDGTFKGEAQAQAGPIAVEVVVEGGKLKDIKIGAHNETKGLGDEAMKTIAAKMIETGSTNVDAVAGATNSSNGFIAAVENALLNAGATQEMLDAQEQVAVKNTLDQDEYTFDVVVIGGGGAGLSAAVEAAATGASVVLIEKTSALGGNTLVSGGGLNVPGSEQQIGLEIEDSVEQFVQDTLKGGDFEGDEALVRVVAENALDSLKWLTDDIGVEFMPDRLQQFGGHSVPRALISKGNKGDELIKKLETRATELGVEIFLETEGTELVTENGAVVAVKADNNGKEIMLNAADGVIIASGGFAADIEMREKYNPNYGERYKTTARPASTGDGIKMAETIGAELVDMEHIQVYPTCNPITGIISYVGNSRFDGALLLNKEGERFVDEMERRDVISNAILEQTEGFGYLVWGQEIETVGNMTQVHKAEYDEFVKDGLLHKADTLEELAEFFKIDTEAFVATIEEFNGYVEAGNDPDFNKGGKLRPIAQGPFYIQKVTPATHHTMGGIKINEQAQVVDTNGNVIENLFAAGEVVGDVHGTNRLGGNAITDIIIFGRIAGQNVVK